VIWIIILILVLVLVCLAVGGFVARSIRQRHTEQEFRERLHQANRDLAEASADDRGWDRERLEAAARSAYAEQRGREPSELLLVEVIDRPGKDEDLAVFQAEAEGDRHTLTLGRRGDEWVLERIE